MLVSNILSPITDVDRKVKVKIIRNVCVDYMVSNHEEFETAALGLQVDIQVFKLNTTIDSITMYLFPRALPLVRVPIRQLQPLRLDHIRFRSLQLDREFSNSDCNSIKTCDGLS